MDPKSMTTEEIYRQLALLQAEIIRRQDKQNAGHWKPTAPVDKPATSFGYPVQSW